jgi:hypothetical protein
VTHLVSDAGEPVSGISSVRWYCSPESAKIRSQVAWASSSTKDMKATSSASGSVHRRSARAHPAR